MAEKIAITFDEDNQIRVLESDKFRETTALKNESISFIKSTLFIHSNLTNEMYRSSKFRGGYIIVDQGSRGRKQEDRIREIKSNRYEILESC